LSRCRKSCKLLKRLEARVGIEPTHKGFADLSLTAWVPRPWTGNLTSSGGVEAILREVF
jgi:hypothetical protein